MPKLQRNIDLNIIVKFIQVLKPTHGVSRSEC